MSQEEAECIPEVVYHYTSMDTLLKIVESGQIWATNIRYLNDVSEREHCLKVVSDYFKSQAIPESADLDSPQFSNQQFKDDSGFEDVPFVASFSAERDSLSQWRSYCPRGNGVCIGFSTEALRKAYVGHPPSNPVRDLIRPALVGFAPVKYLSRDDNAGIKSLVAEVLKDANEIAEDFPGLPDVEELEKDSVSTNAPVSGFWWYSLSRYSSRVKHKSFQMEAEYRMLVTMNFGLNGLIKYRSSRSTLVPYVPVSLPNPSRFPKSHGESWLISPKPYFIESVTIGPTPHPDLSADALRGLLFGNDREVRVSKSEVPFRDW